MIFVAVLALLLTACSKDDKEDDQPPQKTTPVESTDVNLNKE